MNKRKKNAVRTVALVIAAIMIITTLMMGLPMVYGASDTRVYAAAGDVADPESLKEELDFMSRLIQGLKEIYKDEVSYEVLVNGAYEGIFASLNDPYSEYYDTKEDSDALEEEISGEFGGIGVRLKVSGDDCVVDSVLSNSPAQKAGIKIGDILEAADGVSLSKKTLAECVSAIRGEVDTQVRLTVRRKTQTLTMLVTRELIRLESVSWKILENNIAYVRLEEFDSDSDREFRQALKEIKKQGAQAMILDLRDNPGGYLRAAVNVADSLLPEEGKIIIEMTRQGQKLGAMQSTGAGRDFRLPLVLLINEKSASASEIVAGALQDHKAARLVGTTTFGKGIAQSITHLQNGGSMKVSTYYFTRPGGAAIHQKGVSPDVCVINGAGLTDEEIAAAYEKLAPMTEKTKYYQGQAGLNVYGAQQRLGLLGEKLALSARMDEPTVEAIKKFQAQMGMCPYGGLDYSTMAALEQATIRRLSGETEDLQLKTAVELLTEAVQ